MAAAAGTHGAPEMESSMEVDGERSGANEQETRGESSGGESSPGDGEEDCSGTAAPVERARAGEMVLPVRELWCLRAERAFPGAEVATRAVVDVLERQWGDRAELHGPPVEVRVQTRGDVRTAAQFATGLAAIVRRPFDGWEVQSLGALRSEAWQVQASLDDCLIVKAFGRSSNHAKEFNWLGTAVEKFVEEGGMLNVAIKDFKMGYVVLRNSFARDNGPEWTGAVLGCNLTMAALCEVVGWVEEKIKLKQWELFQEFKLDADKRRVVSATLPPEAVGYGFKTADHISGSASLLVESPLDVAEFEIGEADELPGLEIIYKALGEDIVFDVEPSIRGLGAKGIVRVRVKCALRHEKGLRLRIKKLIRATAEVQKTMAFETAEGKVEVKFHSMRTLRQLEAAENEGGGPFGRSRFAAVDPEEARRKDALLEELQAHQLKHNAALDRVIDQVEKLAVSQAQSQAQSRQVEATLAAEQERSREHARQVHASLAAEQAVALRTVNQLASVFTSFLDRERSAPMRLRSDGSDQGGTSRFVVCAAEQVGSAVEDTSISSGCKLLAPLPPAQRASERSEGGATASRRRGGGPTDVQRRKEWCEEAQDRRRFRVAVTERDCGVKKPAKASRVHLKLGRRWSRLEKTFRACTGGEVRAVLRGVRVRGKGTKLLRGRFACWEQGRAASGSRGGSNRLDKVLVSRSVFEGNWFSRDLRWTRAPERRENEEESGRLKTGAAEKDGVGNGVRERREDGALGEGGTAGRTPAVAQTFGVERPAAGTISAKGDKGEGVHCGVVLDHGGGSAGPGLAMAWTSHSSRERGCQADLICTGASVGGRGAVDQRLAVVAPEEQGVFRGRSDRKQEGFQATRFVADGKSGGKDSCEGGEEGSAGTASLAPTFFGGRAVRTEAFGDHEVCGRQTATARPRGIIRGRCERGLDSGGAVDKDRTWGELRDRAARPAVVVRVGEEAQMDGKCAAARGGALASWRTQGGSGAETASTAASARVVRTWCQAIAVAEGGSCDADGQQWIGSSATQAVQGWQGAGGCLTGPGLGNSYGNTGRAPAPYPSRAASCVRRGGHEYHGAGGSVQCGGAGHATDSQASRLEGRRRGPAEICIHAVRDRRHGGGGQSSVRGTLVVRTGGRGESRGGEGVNCSVGIQTPKAGSVRFEQRQHLFSFGGARGSRHSDDQFQMCTVVHCQRAARGVCGSSADVRAGTGGEPGLVGAGQEVVPEGHCAGVRCWSHPSMPTAAVASPAGDDRTVERVGVVATIHLPTQDVTGMDAKEQTLDLRHSQDRERQEKGDAGAEPSTGQVDGQVGGAWRLGEVAAKGSDKAARLRLRGGGPAFHPAPAGYVGSARCEEMEGADSGTVGQTTPQLFEGKCLFWNARQFTFPEGAEGSNGDKVGGTARLKLEKLEQQIDRFSPWMIALLEVNGDIGRMRLLRGWFRRRGFPRMVFLVGEGSSRTAGEAAPGDSQTNGLVLAVNKDLMVRSASRLGFRTLAVSLLHKPSQRRLAVALLHGVSADLPAMEGEELMFEGYSFAKQLATAADWCEEHDGVILMDANRVPCRNWRSPATAGLASGDKALRKSTGWSCHCCNEGSAGDGEERRATFIGGQLEGNGEPRWTRWGRSATEEGCRSRLDVGLAFGNAVEIWRDTSVVLPEGPIASNAGWVSDHALVVYELALRDITNRGEARPLPVRLGPMPRKDQRLDMRSAWAHMGVITSSEKFLEELRRLSIEARRTQSSEVQALTKRLRAAGEQAAARAKALTRGFGQELMLRTCFDDGSESRSWQHRLQVAAACAQGKSRLERREWNLLFHRRTGLNKWCPRFSDSDVAQIPWQLVLARCRRQIARAEGFMNKRQESEDQWLADKCRQIQEQVGDGDLASHVRTIWRMIGKKGGESVQLSTIHVGDDKAAPQLSVEDPEFLREAGRIGERFVRNMDMGSVPNAFAAWLEIFCTRWEPLSGPGRGWKLEEEFTFEVFEKTLWNMRGKAVGAGGLSVELLLAASFEVRWMFHKAILNDVSSRCIAPEWRRVIYVLLRKPPPNDAAIVAQRREIALMPQDLKILLQGVRSITYARISERLDAAQYGWRKGMGCADPGIALACVLDQAHRLQHTAWILYIDLASFFPAINRAIACDCELFMGLPAEVTKIMAQIYGGQCGVQTQVHCQYETGGGLGAPFANGVGRLMGCPISPDSAKILLNSVLLAIKASVTGVHLWPFEGETICQLAYADDWVGLFDDVRQLRKALFIWLTWAEIVGARLGIKGLVKTVVSGVVYEGGKPCTPPDPKLTDLEGVPIPLLSCDELYKHLGVPRAASAHSHRSWTGFKGVTGIRDKLRAGIRRLKQLRPGRTSTEQFICISNVLLGGLGGFYGQAAVISDKEFEQIECEWRRCYNRFARRDPSSATLPLYTASVNWTKGRTHLARVGVAALFTSVAKLLADTEASPAQAAVRSAIALAMFSWGCRRDPNVWEWNHLKEPLQKASRNNGARYIGDAWMLACTLLEEGRKPEASREIREEHIRVTRWGRWRGWAGEGASSAGPLHPRAIWFGSFSKSLFDSRSQGGCGLDVRPLLIKAGVVEVHHLCAAPFMGGEDEGRWMRDRALVEGRLQVKVTAALWKQWTSAISVLERRNIRPVRPAKAEERRLRRYQQLAVRRPANGSDRWESTARELRRQRLEGDTSVEVEDQALALRASFSPMAPAVDSDPRSRSSTTAHATIICCLEGVETEQVEQWGAWGRRDLPLAVEEGWDLLALKWQRMIAFQEESGWPFWAEQKREVLPHETEDLPPALQLALRARLALGKDAKTTQRGYGEKLRDLRVAVDVQNSNWARFCLLQARLDFTHAFASDASEGEVQCGPEESCIDAWGWCRRLTAAAVVAHTGRVSGGCLKEDESTGSYVGELRAVIEVMKAAPAGSRVLLVLDSTSPVKAWLRFRTKGARARRQYRAAGLLDELDRAVSKHKLVYLLWQRSHCGAPANEWADREADRIRTEGATWLEGEKPSEHLWALWPSRVEGSLFRWAVRAGERHAHVKMLAKAGRRQVGPEEGDWELGIWQGDKGAAAALLRDERLTAVDKGHVIGQEERRAMKMRGCMHGCEGATGSWQHYAFCCAHPALVEERRLWRSWVHSNRERCDRLHLHKQMECLVGMLRDDSTRSAGSLRSEEADREQVRRLLCGFVTKEEAGFCDAAAAHDAWRGVVTRGLRVLCVAVSLEKDVRWEVERQIQNNRLSRKVMREWRKLVDCSGPFRVAALRQLRYVRGALEVVCASRTASGGMSANMAAAVRTYVNNLLGLAREEVERRMDAVGDEAVIFWFLQMKWWGTWARRAETTVFRRWEAWTPATGQAMSKLHTWYREVFVIALGVSNFAHKRSEWAGPLRSARRRQEAACRAFARMGGYKKLRAVRRRVVQENVGRRTEGLRISMDNFCKEGSCSGRPLEPIEEGTRLEVIILRSSRKRPRTVAQERAWGRGRQADKKGRWAVEEISRVRRSLGSRGWEALVKWAGGHEDSWVLFKDLCPSLREEAWGLAIELSRPWLLEWGARQEERRMRRSSVGKRGVQEVDARPLGARKSPRLTEVKEKEDKLRKALVRVEGGASEAAARGKGKRRILRVWGLHEDGEGLRVKVAWEFAGILTPSMERVTELPECIRWRVVKYGRYNARTDGASSSMDMC